MRYLVITLLLFTSGVICAQTSGIGKGSSDTLKTADSSGTTPTELRKLIIEKTQPGGRLDYFTPIKGKEYQAVAVKPNVITTQLAIALYKWGKACNAMGVNTVEDALSIFEEFKGRKPDQREETYIKMGFNKELEK